MRTSVAVTAPVESALPSAVTHLPTLTDAAVVAASVVIFVSEVTVTVLFLVPLSPNCRAAIASVLPVIEVTLPDATAPPRNRPHGKPEGRAPDGKPEGRAPDGKPDGRAPPPMAHAPEPTMRLLAVNDVASKEVPDGATAVTQSPALIAASVVAIWWVNFVDDVHVTATWPTCGFCTCIVVPLIAATVPDAAGPRKPALPCPAGGAWAGVLGESCDVGEALLHPASTNTPAMPTTATRTIMEGPFTRCAVRRWATAGLLAQPDTRRSRCRS